MINFRIVGADHEKTVKPPSPSLLKAFAEADWEAILPRLAAHAQHCLRRVGWADGRSTEPSRMSVTDVVNTAIERCLDGRRRWNDDSPPEFVAFLCGIIRSLVSDEKKMFIRDHVQIDGAAVDAALDPNTDLDETEAEEGRSVICAAVEACAKGDDALESFFLSVLDGNTKREQIAESLG